MHSQATWKPWTLARGVARIAKAASSTNEQESLTSTRASQSRGSIRGVARTKAATVQTTSNRERTSASKKPSSRSHRKRSHMVWRSKGFHPAVRA